jgi:hypothetical protein
MRLRLAQRVTPIAMKGKSAMPQTKEVGLQAEDGSEDFIEGTRDPNETNVKSNVFRVHWSKVVIKQGRNGLLFRNGGLLKIIQPGQRWRTWDILGRYAISILDVRDKPYHIVASATVRGPEDAPPCKLRVQFQLVMRVSNVTQLVNTEKWKEIVSGIIRDYVFEVGGTLQYDQYNYWSTKLRNELRAYLVAESPRAVGVDIIRVSVEDLDGETESDKRQLKIYQEVSKIKVEAERDIGRAKNDRTADRIRAESAQERGQILGMNPALVELSRTPGGLEIIRADARLREMAIGMGIIREEAAPGLLPNTSGAIPPLGLPGPSGSYPPAPSTTAPYPGALEGAYSSAPYPPSTPNPYYPPSGPIGAPAAAASGPVELITARIERERAALPVPDNAIDGEGEPWGDANGQLTQPYKLNVTLGWGLVLFVLPGGFPRAAPSYAVTFADPQKPSIPLTPVAWTPDMKLNDVLTQIIKQYA